MTTGTKKKETKKKEQGKKGGAKKGLLMALKILLALLLFLFLSTIAVNLYVVLKGKRHILTVDEWKQELTGDPAQDPECILVLGCSYYPDGDPSPMLKDRLDRTAELYRISPRKIIVSGDHTPEEYYNEVKAMKAYLVAQGIPSEDIYMDHHGYSTYESVYRAYHVFGVRRMTVVTQTYHLYRAVCLGLAFDIETTGVAAENKEYSGSFGRETREIVARNKDFLFAWFQPSPTKYKDDRVSLEESGDLTDAWTE